MNIIKDFLTIKFEDGEIVNIRKTDIKAIRFAPKDCQSRAIYIETSARTYDLNHASIDEDDYLEYYSRFFRGN